MLVVFSATRDKYSGKATDVWAMGITLYCFVFGKVRANHVLYRLLDFAPMASFSYAYFLMFQLTLVIIILTLKTVDISSHFFSSVSSHLPVSEV
jgi:serine/threonine protein kinase